MKANSPICAMENEHRMAVFSDCPESMKPIVPKMDWPKMMARVMMSMVDQCWITMVMSTNMPTDTKKMAPKRFFTGSTMRSIFFASIVSASILPMTNDPNAGLNPTNDAPTAMEQHSASETMSSTSSFISDRMARRNVGTKKSPTTNHSTRKKTILSKLPSMSASPSAPPPLAIVVSTTIMTIASTSSSISTLMTSEENCCCRNPRSSKAL